MFSLYFCFRFSCYGPSHSVNYRTRDHVWLTISRPLIAIFRMLLQRSIVHRNVYKKTEKRLSMSGNDATAEGQTCVIAWFLHLSEKKPDCLTHYVSAIYRDIPDIFAAVDCAPKDLQGDRKSYVYASKCRHSKRSNVRDRSISALVGKNLSPHSPLLELGNGCR